MKVTTLLALPLLPAAGVLICAQGLAQSGESLLPMFNALPALAPQTEVAEAQPQAIVPLPSILDFTRGAGFGLALGVGVEYEAAYDGSDEYELELDPAGAVQWRSGQHMLFFEGTELGWRGRLADRWLLQAGARYEDGLDPADSDKGALDGIAKRSSHLTGFIEARRALDEDWRNWVGARVLAGDSEFGALGVLAAGHRFGKSLDGLGTEVYLFSTFGDRSFINKDFGVSASDALASGLAETRLDGGYRSSGIQAVHRRYLTSQVQLIAQAGIELYDASIGKSPIARNDFEAELSLAFVWHF
jgi:outer membrane scaffolding protein for murein synthesis (MipA/OmpV family)